jgi:hypothetical protein
MMSCHLSTLTFLSHLSSHLVQVIDELGQVLNGVDVVVGGWGDQGHTRLGAAQLGNVGGHLGPGQLATLTCRGEEVGE